ncbi:T9SS type A sorting domain-containing protein [candidate division KSB1 bacterium]|nr:T9SS type A sorting domain-containing protein [candidate division KSB1 bacterium]
MFKYKYNVWILFTLLFIFGICENIFAADDHWVKGTIRYSDGTFPSDITFRAYISSPDRHTDVITDDGPDHKYHHDTGGVEIQLKYFHNNWSPGETLCINFVDTHGNPLTVYVVLTSNPEDNFGTYTMSRTKAKLTIKHYMESWGRIEPVDGEHIYNIGEVVQLRAYPAKGYRFKYWTTNVADPYAAFTTVTMNGDQKVDGVFSKLYYTVTMVSDPPEGGVTDPPTGVYTDVYNSGDVIQLTATPNPGYRFVSWSGNVVDSTSQTTSITILQHETITARFEQASCTLNMHVNPGNGGTVTPAVGEHTYDAGTVVPISAVPQTGYLFVNWTGDVAEPDNPNTTVTMNGDKDVTANFSKPQVTLNLSVSPAGSGTTVPAAGQYSVDEDSVVTLQAVAGPGYQFVNWTGAVADPNNPNTTVTMSENKTVTANFARIKVTLTMSVSPAGWGTTAPAVGQYAVNMDSVVSIQAVAGEGYQFVNWTGEVADPNNPVTTVTMTGNKTVTANFSRPRVTLNVSVSPAGSGTTVPAAGQYSVEMDSVVTLQAVAGQGYQFVNWTGDVADPNSPNTTVTITGPKTVTANFEKIQVTLGLAVSPAGSGTTLPAAGLYSVDMDSVVTIQAVAGPGYQFVNWTGEVADPNNPVTTVTMTGNKAVTAKFEKLKVTLTLSVLPEGWGTSIPTAGQYTVEMDSVVAIQAVAGEGYQFVNWTGEVADPNNPVTTVTMTGHKTVIANFEKAKISLTISVSPSGSGTTVPAAGQYTVEKDSVLALQAIANEGYFFVNWTGDVADPNNPVTTVTITGNMEVKANFAKPKVSLTLSVLPEDAGTTVPPVGQYSVDTDSVVMIEARAAAGFQFVNWTGKVAEPDSARTTVTMDSSRNITANFIALTDVVVTTNPVGLRIVVDGNPYYSPQVFSWVGGSEHTIGIDSTEQNGSKGIRYLYEGWSDEGEQIHNIITGDKFLYTANFKTQYYLFTLVEPENAGIITPAAPGAWFDSGTEVPVTVTENPETGYVFWEWSGNLNGSANPDTVVMDTTKSVTARFIASDSEAPVLTNVYPVKEALEIPRNTSIQFKLSDEVSGINPSTLQFTVEAFTVISNGVDQTEGRTNIVFNGHGCSVFYQPEQSFDEGESIVVNIECEDQSLFKNRLDSTFSFKIGSSQIVYTKRDTVNQTGGVVFDDTTGITVTIPANALADTTEITINVVKDYPELPPGRKGLSLGAYFGPSGLQFADSVTISIPYDQAVLDSAGVTNPMDLKVYYFSVLSGQWITLKVIGADAKNIFVKVKEFCYLVYGVKYTTLSKPNTPVGQTKLLVNTLYGFETSKVSSLLGHAVEYRFDWGDGYMSSWSQDTTAAHKWTDMGRFGVVAFARSITDSTQTNQSDTLFVTVTDLSSIDPDGAAPKSFRLSQNFPNPFNPQTTIKYQVPKNINVTLEIYNVNGQKIKTLVNEEKVTGSYTVIWDGRDDYNVAVSSGLYFLKMKAGDYTKVVKMSFLK